MGKGSDRRMRSSYCTIEKFNDTWDNIFSKKDAEGLNPSLCGCEERPRCNVLKKDKCLKTMEEG